MSLANIMRFTGVRRADPASRGVLLSANVSYTYNEYRGADKSLARPERKEATATEDVDFHISYL
jgi:hypothetical protein